MSLEKKVFWIDEKVKKPSENLAINSYYVNLVKEGKYDLIGRIYRNTRGVILGYDENVNDLNLDFCKKQDYEVVRRFTGGSAVIVDPETSICYTLIFNPEKFGKDKDITKLYLEIAIPLAKNLGREVSVEGTYYLRIRKNGYSVPFAGHAMSLHDRKIVQFDGIINRTSFDLDVVSNILKLRELYLSNNLKYIKSDGRVYDIKGKSIEKFDLDQAKLLRREIDELRRIIGLMNLGIDDHEFLILFKKTIAEVFGDVKEESVELNKSVISSLQEKIKNNLNKGKRSGLGHCYVDFIEPEPKIHYG